MKNTTKKLLKKFIALTLMFALLTGISLTYKGSSNEVLGAASSSSTSVTTRTSVHDPSIRYDAATNKYYIFGSHLGQATTTDLRNWTPLGTQGYSNTTVYGSQSFEGYYYIKNVYSNLYMDVANGSSANGTNIQQWTYNGLASQTFRICSAGNGLYYILTGASNYQSALDVNGTAVNGANIEQWPYWGGDMQLFRIVANADGSYTFLTKSSNFTSSLDVFDWSTTAGGNVNQWTYWGGDLQHWKLVKAGGTGKSTGVSNANLTDSLKQSYAWAGYNDQDSSGGHAVWAPDVLFNPSYVWADGSKGAYMMYYSTSSTYIRSCIGFSVSKSITGPFEYVDTVMYSGFTNYDNNVTTTSALGSKTVNTHYKNTNIPTLIDQGKLSSVRTGWFNSNGSFNNSLFPNAIDPTLIYDASGKLWMTYGSWSGGIYILELNPATGQPIYPKTASGNIDGYFGTKIAGGYTKSGEGPYIIYDAASGYYFLYVTYGWLASEGGYHMRLYRSRTINGNYVDAAGNSAIFSSTTNPATRGIKLIGNYKFSTLAQGYMAGGHNSAIVDDDGQRYLVYHTRFNDGYEFHEVRVHQQFLNQDNWPVTAVYEYLGNKISQTGYSSSDMVGTYEFVNHGLDASTGNVKMLPTYQVTLNSNGTISGNFTGTWSSVSGTYYCTMVINGVTYKGIFYKQRDESAAKTERMTFSLIGNNNESIWGSKLAAASTSGNSTPGLDGTYYIKSKLSNLYLDVENGSSANGSNVRQWSYNGSQAQMFKLVSDGNGYYSILTGASNYASSLDVEGGSSENGANILQWTYWGGDMQKFQVTRQADGSFAIKTKVSGNTSGLDVFENSTAVGANIAQWSYWGGNGQLWNLVKVS